VDIAAALIERCIAADWAPVQFEGRLHDRASYRYFWQVLERAQQTGLALPDTARRHFAEPATPGH
jgi:citrate lyase subunit beta/citryl-CoA lyase